MKIIYWLIAAGAVAVILFIAVNSSTDNRRREDESGAEQAEQIMKDIPVQIIPISHATLALAWGDMMIYADPTGGAAAFARQLAPHIIVVTDIHSDHWDAATISAIIGDAALIVPQAVKDMLPDNLASRAKVLANGETAVERGFRIEAIPMYNLPNAPNSHMHTKSRGNGYVIGKDGIRVYIAGDTAGIPEMRALADIDIAFVPMNLPYTMDVDEAADAVLAFRPKQVYPYHFRTPDGFSDISRFKALVNAGNPNIEVILLNWYPGVGK